MLERKFSGPALPALLLACGLAFGATAAAQEATATRTSMASAPAPVVIEEMLELDEVVVHGTNLRDRIVKAEDRFFKLYNELNKDSDYDINCAYVSLEQDTRIQDRLCTPGFYVNAIVESMQWTERCRGTQDESGNYVPPPPCYTPPPPELVLVDRTDEYAKNVMDVIRTDPRLQEMAGELDELHLERNRLMRRYVELKSEENAQRAAKVRYRPKIR